MKLDPEQKDKVVKEFERAIKLYGVEENAKLAFDIAKEIDSIIVDGLGHRLMADLSEEQVARVLLCAMYLSSYVLMTAMNITLEKE